MSELQLCEGKSIERQSLEFTQNGEPSRRPHGRHGPRGLHHQSRQDNIRKRKRVEREREEGRKGKGREEKRTFQRRGARKLSLFHEAG